MSFGRMVAPLLLAAFGALVFSNDALAGCIVEDGVATTFNCDATGVNVRADSDTDINVPSVTLNVTDMTIEGTDDSTGYITYHNKADFPTGLTLNIENTSVDSPAWLGVFVATGDLGTDPARGGITLTVDEASSITAWDAGIYARAYDGGDVVVTSYAEIFAGALDDEMVFGGDGINATSDGGAVTLTNYGDVTSYAGRGIYADGGYVNGAATVSIYNEGTVDAYGDAVRAIAGGEFGTDAEITNYGTVIGHDRRGIVAWSASGDTTIDNYGEVTSYGGSGIYGMADAGKVTISNSAKVRVIDEDPDTDDTNDDYFTGIRAEVDGTGDVEVNNLAGGDILSYLDGIYASTKSGDAKVTNDGLVIGSSGAVTIKSADGDVTVENSGTMKSEGVDCWCAGTVTIVAANAGDVSVDNKTGGVIAANLGLTTIPTAEGLDTADVTALTTLALESAIKGAIYADLGGAYDLAVTNGGTVIGTIIVDHEDEPTLGTARIENDGLWVTTNVSGFGGGAGVIANTGRLQSLGATQLYGSVQNSGDIVISALGSTAPEWLAPAYVAVYGDYDATDKARLVLDWPDESLTVYAPVLNVMGDVTGVTEVVIARDAALEDLDWSAHPKIPLIHVDGETDADAGHFTMGNQSYGLLSFRLVYEDGDGQDWYLAADIEAANVDPLTDIPFAARNLFKLATDGVSDRLDDLRNAYASPDGGAGPMGYAASPDDPVTAALAMSTPSRPATNAWVKTTGHYGQGDGYDALSGVLEAGIDATVDTGGGQLTGGAFAGTGASRLGFELADSEATLTGPLVGAYANYSSDRAFLGVVAAAQSLSADATLNGAATSFGGLTYGGRVDAGYRFGDELIIEPAVALAASHTEFDTFVMNAIDVGFVDTDSFAAEARLRIAHEFAFDGVFVTPFAVATLGNDFLGGDGVEAPPSDIVMGNHGGLYGDLSAGVTVANEDETLSGFARGNIGYAAGELSAGLRMGASAAF